ncbi:MAG TPA: Pr6Pr family membrane protein [Flavitalea sp.]|nr:Pr6Pr family membrane protein [Flavitalea sp.]
MQGRTTLTQITLAVGSLTGWFAVITQLYLIIVNRVTGITETLIRYFSFYTILTNILVAVCFTISFLRPKSSLGRFFAHSTTVTGIAVYITVVGLVYNLILRSLWQPQGLQRLVDELLHSLVPILFLIYWLLSQPKSALRWKDAFGWLAYPFLYLLYVLFRGNLSGFYPYPFVNADTLGYSAVFLNCFFLFVAFAGLSMVLIFIHKMLTKSLSVQE